MSKPKLLLFLAAAALLAHLAMPSSSLRADPPPGIGPELDDEIGDSGRTSVSGSGSAGGQQVSGSANVGSDGSVSGSGSGSSGGTSVSGSGPGGFDIIIQDDGNGNIVLFNPPTGDYFGEPAPTGARRNVGFDGGTPEASRSPSGALGLAPYAAGQAADGYMEQKGVDPSSTAGQVVKPYVTGTTIHEGPGSFLYQYDARDNRTRVIDASGGTTRYEYDAAGRLIRSTDAVGNTTRFRYEPNPQGMRVFATDPAGQTTRFQYDVAGRITRVTDPAGQATRFNYDARDNRVSVTDPAGNTTRTEYDASGRALWSTQYDPDGKKLLETKIEYDARGGSSRTTTDTDGSTTREVYDASGRALRSTQYGPDGQSTRYDYDATNATVRITDPSGATTVIHTGPDGTLGTDDDRLLETVQPDGSRTLYRYDGGLIPLPSSDAPPSPPQAGLPSDEEVDRIVQEIEELFQFPQERQTVVRRRLMRGQRQAKGRRRADRRRAANHHVRDRVRHVAVIAVGHDFEPTRQSTLVNHPDRAVGPFD